MASRRKPSDPVCTVCAKPVEAGSLVLFQHGDLVHVRCLNEQFGVRLAELVDRAHAARTRTENVMARAARLVEESRTRRRRRQRKRT